MPARPLPDRPNLEQYKKQAKELLKAANAGDPAAVDRIRKYHSRSSKASKADLKPLTLTLADVQFVIAREHGFESWPKFTRHLEGVTDQHPADRTSLAAAQAIVSGNVTSLDALLREHGEMLRTGPRRPGWWGDYSQGDARAIIAKEHFFENWDGFAAFREALQDPTSRVEQFEAAVEAVIWSGGREHWAGDGYYEIVQQLLRAGANVEEDWLKQDGNASALAKRIDEDARDRGGDSLSEAAATCRSAAFAERMSEPLPAATLKTRETSWLQPQTWRAAVRTTR